MTLIAKILIVASAVGADGKAERKEFKPGEEVTGLSDHDERELLKMKALTDTDREEANGQYDAMRAEHAQREFERERQAVLQKRGSTEMPAGPLTSTDGTGQTGTLANGAGGDGSAGDGQGALGGQDSAIAGDGQGTQGSSAGESAAPAPDASAASAPTPAPAPAPVERSKGTGKGAPKRN
ncbi:MULTISPECIES: hypothetical protein [Comamonas]|uniref:hypothetical protein n=1 Tax=Comamonas TaxID=283 RepID=UPI0001DA68D0|nr:MULTISPECIES: hypothetical protein [Comamonas]EFI60746.1 hypothetical protein CTS44_15028 [Comamonas thiooxydans]